MRLNCSALAVALAAGGVLGVVGMATASEPVVKTDAQGYRASAIANYTSAEPTIGDADVANWSALGPYGGDVQDVAQSPTNPNIVLAGVAPGGSSGGSLYRSTDGGATWSVVSALSTVSVYDIEFTPAGVAFIGTMDGVRTSTNDGATWTNLPLGIGANDQTFDVAIDPSNTQVIYAGIADAIGSQPNNLMRSTDGGLTWSNFTPPVGAATSVKAIAIDPTDSQTIAVGFGGAFGGGSVWVTTDGGATWNDRTAGLPTRPVNDLVYSGGTLYVTGGQLFGSQNFGLFSSTTDGASWTDLSTGWPTLVGTDVEVSGGTILVSTVQGLFRSTDAGATWAFGIGNTSPYSMNSVRLAPGNASKIYTGASSVGVTISTDGGATFQGSSTGIGALDVWSIAANPLNPQELALAFQGSNNGGVYTSTNGGQTWAIASGIPGTRYNTVAFSPGGLLYALSDGPTGIGNEALYRRNADSTWTYLGPNQAANFDSELNVIKFSPTNPDRIILAGADFGATFGSDSTIWISGDAGQTWTKAYDGGEPSKPLFGLDWSADEQVIIAAQTDFTGQRLGGIIRSDDAGATWTKLGAGTNGLPPNYMGSDVLFKNGTFYATSNDNTSGGVFTSADGLNWANSGFTQTAYGIEAGTTAGAFYISQRNTTRVQESTDNAATFAPFNAGLPANPGFVQSLFMASNGRLLLSTSTGTFATETGAACYANCDNSTSAPTLNVLDFNCFLNRFNAGDSYANCDGSTNQPTLNVLDFNCFLNRFNAGCP